ncbi:MAG: DUF305 domain-containing protein [bacterium]
MIKSQPAVAGVALAFLVFAGSSASTAQSSPAARAQTPAEQAKADGGHMPYTAADVHFMQGMIHHHAQAIVMAGWAPSNGARSDVRILAARIDVAQRDEIAFMQRWLRERRETVPDPSAEHDMGGTTMSMSEMPMPDMMMPGMLSAVQMAQLKAARGTDFDRLFLTFMIQHHNGALTMVDQLFGTVGGGQELYVFRFASDVGADQTTEIDRMQLMLDALPTQRNQP